jgi:uncharacterized peroxidase-related enzyme
MTQVQLIDRNQASGTARELLDQIHGAFGTVPGMFAAAANSPATLSALWSAFGAYGAGSLPPKLTEQIAVAVADYNGCEYCLAAHTALGRKAGATTEQLAEAQLGRSDEPKTAAALAFALKLVEHRGQVDGADFDALRAAGFSDEEAVEIVGHVALNLFTNYLNISADVPVDFPAVKLRRAA